eukprot:CAMPEP_0170162468 /NCGR_PEP_ID=MMETSP0033_2-20121228/77100_1 /TAXON_ID=195969 /ORGANISM="Dolichomastix tenuilepis, Strain CCMP3274" /LENGTH=908 /DNA_ID=CAMNT_0010400093 /DNA_START=69 /DNA_END=2793 /DNA_ORIENTATION=+
MAPRSPSPSLWVRAEIPDEVSGGFDKESSGARGSGDARLSAVRAGADGSVAAAGSGGRLLDGGGDAGLAANGCGAEALIALDIDEEALARAGAAVPSAATRKVDVLRCSCLRAALGVARDGPGFDVALIDINGTRELEAVEAAIRAVVDAFRPPLLIVKSRALAAKLAGDRGALEALEALETADAVAAQRGEAAQAAAEGEAAQAAAAQGEAAAAAAAAAAEGEAAQATAGEAVQAAAEGEAAQAAEGEAARAAEGEAAAAAAQGEAAQATAGEAVQATAGEAAAAAEGEAAAEAALASAAAAALAFRCSGCGEQAGVFCDASEGLGSARFSCAVCWAAVADPARAAAETECLRAVRALDEARMGSGGQAAHSERLWGRGGVSLRSLVELSDRYGLWGWTTERVVREFVRPKCAAHGRCRFVELPDMAAHVGPADLFISHVWRGSWGDMIAGLQDAAPECYVWLDVFAVRQFPGNGAEAPPALGAPRDVDFEAVVGRCRALVVFTATCPEISNVAWARLALPEEAFAKVAFLRVWCLAELAAAVERARPIVLLAGRRGPRSFMPDLPDNLFRLRALVDVAKARASVESDRARILAHVARVEGGHETLNERLRSAIAGAAAALRQLSVVKAALSLLHRPDLDPLSLLDADLGNSLVAASGGGFLHLVQAIFAHVAAPPPPPAAAAATAAAPPAPGAAAERERAERRTRALLRHRSLLGRTALMEAALAGQESVVHLLLALGADPHASKYEARGQTALWYAVESGSDAIVERLLGEGGSGDAVRRALALVGPEGKTPLHLGAELGRVRAVRLMLAAAARVGEVGEAGEAGEAAALVEARARGGVTPLLSACAFGQAACARVLVAAGADARVTDTRGRSAPALARAAGAAELAEELLRSAPPALGAARSAA